VINIYSTSGCLFDLCVLTNIRYYLHRKWYRCKYIRDKLP